MGGMCEISGVTLSLLTKLILLFLFDFQTYKSFSQPRDRVRLSFIYEGFVSMRYLKIVPTPNF